MPPAWLFVLKVALAIEHLLWFHINIKHIFLPFLWRTTNKQSRNQRKPFVNEPITHWETRVCVPSPSRMVLHQIFLLLLSLLPFKSIHQGTHLREMTEDRTSGGGSSFLSAAVIKTTPDSRQLRWGKSLFALNLQVTVTGERSLGRNHSWPRTYSRNHKGMLLDGLLSLLMFS